VDAIDYVKLYIWRLRQKIEKDSRQPRYILTERGIGYRFVESARLVGWETGRLVN